MTLERVIAEYGVDLLSQLSVRDIGLRPVVTLRGSEPVAAAQRWLSRGAGDANHQGFPVLDDAGRLIGVVTRRDLHAAQKPAGGGFGDAERFVHQLVTRDSVVVHPEASLREAADLMVVEGVGRLPVVDRAAPETVIGIITRSDLLTVHAQRLRDSTQAEQSLDLRRIWAD